uniref:Si:dkey-17e16.9 n=1 Tax=Gouania willdenowi TaxID=441366 RepID=A0A8C5I457_GOUWI
MAEYKLAVTTGNMINAGTVDHIYVTLFGTKGESERTKLDKFGLNFLQNTTHTYSIKTKSSLGDLLLLQVEKDPFLVLTEDQWFCSKIVVTAPEGEVLFPCYRWISRGELVELRGGKALKSFEEVHPMLLESRKKDLMMRQNLYQWVKAYAQYRQRIYTSAVVVFNVPFSFFFACAGGNASMKTYHTALISRNKYQTCLPAYPVFSLPEYVTGHWMDDDFFGYQFLNGTNPCVIRKCSELPLNFPVTDEMVKPFLETGSSLIEEILKGNIFICDHKIMENIPTRMYGEECLQMPASMCLFYMNPQNKLMPIAIQLSQQPSEQSPIFLPSDSDTDWLLAKMFVKSAHTVEYEAIYHFMSTHLLAEVLAVATLRNFPPVHPIYKLLIPHFRYTLHVNIRSRSSLFGPEGPFSISTLGYEGIKELMKRGLSEMTYGSLCLPYNIRKRGLESIPNYYYRDDGLKLWNIIKRFVRKMMEHYYHSDGEVIRDTELQAWIQEVFKRGFMGSICSGIPSYLFNVMDLVKFLTMVIFTVTARHAAFNNGQFDYLSWILNGSLLLRKPPPTTKGQSSMETILETLPNIGESVQFASFVLVLSEKYSDMVYERFDEPAPKRMIREFQAELSCLSELIQTRNAGLELPYTYLDPTHIENSITI